MDIDQSMLREIIRLGVYAPSGDNSQPWRFRIRNNSVDIFNLPEKDNPYYNFRQNGSLVAHGGLIENILIAASREGVKPEINLFPDKERKDLIATLIFDSSVSAPDPLYAFIPERVTNRKSYDKKITLTFMEKDDLLRSAEEIGIGKIRLVEDRAQIKKIGEAMSINEVVALETKKLHNIFFGDMVWSENEEKNKKSGLFIKTLELPLPVEGIFRLLRYWPVANSLNHLGFAKMAARGNAQIYSAASAMGVVTIPGNGPTDFIMAGRLMQRVWLKATRLGLSLQPVTGILFLMQRVLAGEAKDLKSYHVDMLIKAYKNLQDIFQVEEETMAMLFRIGHGGQPSARSSRLAPDIV